MRNFYQVQKSKKLLKIEKEILQKINEWFDIQFKDIIGKYPVKIKTRNYNHLKVIRYYCDWIESFVDEDTGDVVDITRTSLVKIERYFVGDELPKIQLFYLSGKKCKSNLFS